MMKYQTSFGDIELSTDFGGTWATRTVTGAELIERFGEEDAKEMVSYTETVPGDEATREYIRYQEAALEKAFNAGSEKSFKPQTWAEWKKSRPG